jgi:pimeloyl-ACP methyl ester carboxylesterase
MHTTPRRLGVVLVALMTLMAQARAQDVPEIAVAERMVPAPQNGLEIYVRNKHLTGAAGFDAAHTLVFVHGATYPASTSFDLPLGGRSWMDDLARHGYDVYLLDLPGYGRSTRPPEMDQPASANPPLETTDQAVAALGAVVDDILRRQGLASLDVMGWSWGTAIAGGFAAEHPEKVHRLVLYAALWVIEGPIALKIDPDHLGAYRMVSREDAKKRWLSGLTPEQQQGLIPEGWFTQWADATFATDPKGAAQNPPVLRAPNGVVFDILRYWQKGQPTWDPAKLTMPVLMVQAEWDHDTPPYMSHTLFPLITHAPWKEYVMLGEGTHTIVMEKNRRQLFQVVQDFLDMPAPR